MSRKNKQEKGNFFTEHKRFTLTLILFFIVLPVLFFSAIYFWQGVIVKHELFEDKTNKVVNEQKYYTITADLKEIKYPIDEESPYKYKFSYTVTKSDKIINDLSNLKIEFQLAPKFHPYTSKVTSRGSILSGTFDMDFEFDMEKSRFPFLAPKGPFLYVKISFTEIILDGSNQVTEEHVYVLKVDYTTDNLIHN